MLNKEKLNANAVGVAAHSDPQTNKTTKFDCRGGRLCPPANKQNGITLIALIITVIVMLILVGVTINVALNGNLFGKADEAKRLTQIAADKEELQIEILTAYNEKTAEVELSTLKTNLEAKGWKVTISGDKAICTSPKGNTFTVDKEGKITEGGTHPGGGNEPSAFTWKSVGLENIDTSTEYIAENGPILNFSADGKLVVLSNGMVITTVDATKETTGTLTFNIDMEGTKVSTTVTMANENDVNLTLGGSQVYTCKKTIVDNETIYSNEEVLKALGITNYIGTYNGTWTVIERDASGNPTKLVSTSDVTYCELGETDNLEKSISDYKNAESILNTSAQQATGIASAESIAIEDIYSIIGEENVNKETSGTKYNYYYNTEDSKVYSKYQTGTDDNGEIIWSDPVNTDYSSQTFVNDNGSTVVVGPENYNVTLTHTHYNYDLTDDQKAEIGTLASGYYWLASPCVYCDSNSAYFRVRSMGIGSISSDDLFSSYGNAYDSGGGGVRAVVSVSGL